MWDEKREWFQNIIFAWSMPQLYLPTLGLVHGAGFYAARSPEMQGNDVSNVKGAKR